MSPPLGPPIAVAWLLLGHASFWYMLEHHSIDLYEFFGKGNWPAGAAVVTLLGPLTLPTYFILKWEAADKTCIAGRVQLHYCLVLHFCHIAKFRSKKFGEWGC